MAADAYHVPQLSESWGMPESPIAAAAPEDGTRGLSSPAFEASDFATATSPNGPVWEDEQLIPQHKLDALLATIDPNPQPQTYRRMNLELVAQIFHPITPGTETLAQKQVRMDAELAAARAQLPALLEQIAAKRAQTVHLPVVRLDENDMMVGASPTRELPALSLDRDSRIRDGLLATGLETAELPVPPTDSAGRLLPTFEEQMAEEAALNERRKTLGLVGETIFLNFGRTLSRFLTHEPDVAVAITRRHQRLARNVLGHMRITPEDVTRTDYTATVHAAEQLAHLDTVVAYALASAGIVEATDDEQLAQVVSAVASGLERATSHRLQVSQDSQRSQNTSGPAADPHPSQPPEQSSPASEQRHENVDAIVSIAAHGLEALRGPYMSYPAERRRWVKTVGLVDGIGRELQAADAKLYDQALLYFYSRDMPLQRVIAAALLAYDGPQNSAAFIPVLRRSLRTVMAEAPVPRQRAQPRSTAAS